ncbi:MAG TPA: succinate dehydrogenase assembly factor 2 [Rhizobiales bacterium]|nr:succinate dehydrogenase assembly factor 2 [Hyphomicrobiales bacterium]
MSDKLTGTETRQKRILWRARHRGTKEMDLMLGRYAEENLSAMNADQLNEFEAILDVSDAVLIDWLTGKSPTPEEFQTPMFARIKAQSFLPVDYKKL